MIGSPVFVFDSREKWFPVGVEESLTRYGVPIPPVDQPRIDFPTSMKTQPDDLAPVVYRREVRGGGLSWVQWWLWYLYNPWAVAGVGRHEGDWEFVQIGSANQSPVLVTCSQHKTGGKREAWACEVQSDHPRIYVARGSHAMYFAPGRQGGGLDDCDGRGRILVPGDYEVREFGPWASWDGRWGNSTGEGKSPESPGQQGVRWSAPHLFHSAARS
jgi:hypothetical protein